MRDRGVAPAVALALAFFITACTPPPVAVSPTPTPTREPDTIAVTVLLDLSGGRAPNGTAQRNAIQLWLDQEQARVGPPKLQAKFVDLAGSDARLLLELRRAAQEDRADAVVIGVPIAHDETYARALDVARLPVLLTLPAPEPMTMPAGRWAFALAPTYADLAGATVTDATLRGVLQPTLLASDESPSAIGERFALAREFEQRGLVPPTVVAVTSQDAAQRMRAGAAFARSLLCAGSGATYLEAVRSLAASGVTPRVYLSYLMETADATALREAGPNATWPGSRHIAAVSVPPSSAARATFVQTYTDRHGAPSTLAASAFDAFALIRAAAEGAHGIPDRALLRDQLEATTFAGIASRYAFTPARHAGFDSDDLVFLRWSSGAGRPGFALAPEPAPKGER